MKTKILFALVCLLMTAQMQAQTKATQKILPFPIQQKQLSNGLNVVTVPFNSPGLAAFYIVVRAGSREEVEEGKTGFAHFFEHIMFRGTDNYTKEAYDEVLKSIGASANANTSIDRTVYHMTGNAGKLEKMFEVEADRFQHLKYSEHDFKTEAGAVKGEYTKNSASPYQQLFEKVADVAFTKHTYKHTTMGFFKDVVEMPNQFDYSKIFFDRFYRPEYATIVVVGDVKQEEVNRLAQKYFGQWKKGNYQPKIETEPKQMETKFAHINNANFPPYLSLNFKGPSFSNVSKDNAALDILTTYMFAESGDLYQKLVVKEQKARFIGGGPRLSRDPNLVSIGASLVKATDMQYVKDELTNALNMAKTKPLDAKKLAETKSAIKYGFAMRLESPDQIANSLAQFIWLSGNPESINQYYALYDQVTANDIMEVAKKYFNPSQLTIGTIGPGDEAGLSLSTALPTQEVTELKQPNSNKVIIKLMFKNGSMSDPVGKEGLTNTTASLITAGGTGKLTNKQIQELIYPMAAEYRASIDKEVTVFTFAVHKDFLEKFYPLIKDLMLNPSFTQEDFNRVKSNQQNYVDQVIRASSDEEYSKKALEDLLFRGTRYQHMVQGNTAGVSAITLEDVKKHYANFFTRNNVQIGIAGNYPAEFLTRLKNDVNQLPNVKPDLPEVPKARMANGIEVEIISKNDALGSAIFTGAPLAITRSSNDFAALMVANSYLGEHRKSYGKLYDKIRNVRSMNYGDYSYIEWYDNGGSNMLPVPGAPRHSNYFSLWIRPVQIGEGLKKQYAELKDIETGHAHFALRLAIREVDEMINKGITKESFTATRDFLRSYNKLYIQTPEKQLGFLMDSKFYGRMDYIQEMDALLAKLTVDDVNNAIKKYWQVENMFVTIVTDNSEADPLTKALLENKPSPMSYSNLVKEGLPKAVLAEDDAIANFKLNVKQVKIVDSKDTFK